MHEHANPETPGVAPDSRGVSRRTVVGAAAWSVPVLAVAAATPVAAASVVDGLSIRFLEPWYRTTPDTSYVDVAAVVENVTGGVATPVEGANITFTLSAIPAGSVTPPTPPVENGSGAAAKKAQPAAPKSSATLEAAGATNGRAPSATLPNGLYTGTFGPTGPEGTYLLQPITTGPGWGILKLDASTTVDGARATATTYIEIAIKGPLYSAGYPTYGILGNGNSAAQPTPSYVDYREFDVAEVSGRVDYGGTLRTTSGDIYSWGLAYYANNGDGTTNTYWTPNKVTTAYDGQKFSLLARSARYNQGAIDTNGAAYGWGNDAYGQLCGGLGPTRGTNVLKPRLIHDSLSSGVVQLGLNDWTGYALKDDGTVWSWGFCYEGSIGRDDVAPGTTTAAPVQVLFPGDVKIVDLAVGWAAGYAVDENGTLWGWGSGWGYRLGQGSDYNMRLSPVQIGTAGEYAKVFSSSYTYAAAAIRTDGTATYWGYAAWGQAGNGTSPAYATTPVDMGISDVVQLEITMYSTYARTQNGNVYYAGWNGWGHGGTGDQTASASFRKVVNLDGPATDISSTYGAGYFLTSGS